MTVAMQRCDKHSSTTIEALFSASVRGIPYRTDFSVSAFKCLSDREFLAEDSHGKFIV
jgi:hypothetical protein